MYNSLYYSVSHYTCFVIPGDTTTDPSAASSLLPIISSQRERFKLRNLELEAVS